MEGILKYDVSKQSGAILNAFILLIDALIVNLKLIGPLDVYPQDQSWRLLKEEVTDVDFVIVGAGASGCVLAQHLSEQRKWSVLLLEAGGFPTTTTEVPGLYSTLLEGPMTWNHELLYDQKSCNAHKQKVCSVHRGKVLGGTSTINDLLYSRANPADFVNMNIPSWSSNNTDSLYSYLEDYQGSSLTQFHFGTTGSMILNHFNYVDWTRDWLANTYKSVYFQSIPKRQFVGYLTQVGLVDKGERQNMAKSFLTPVKDNPYLLLSTDSEVLKVRLCPLTSDRRAIGVSVKVKDTVLEIKARKEVILTTGAINNVKILMNSGLGPKNYLESVNIKLAGHLPSVGDGLQIQVKLPVFIGLGQCHDESCTREESHVLDNFFNDIYNYIIHRKGRMATVYVRDFILYFNTQHQAFSLPDVAFMHEYYPVKDKLLPHAVDSYAPSILKKLKEHNEHSPILVIYIVLLKPLSRSSVRLNETYHYNPVVIKGNFLSDKDNTDFDTLYTAFSFVHTVLNTPEMKEKEAKILDLDVPPCRNFMFCSVPYVKCYMRHMLTPTDNVASGLKLGKSCSDASVVNQETLEMHNVRCLRIADSSVLPQLYSGNNIATDAMIGLRVAELLKQKWGHGYVSPFDFLNVTNV